MSDIALVQATFPDAQSAAAIAETVVAERLAACANILAPCTSVYRWEGAIERAEEVPVLFKTRITAVAALRARIGALHPYDLPVIEAWPAAVGDAAARWVGDETA